MSIALLMGPSRDRFPLERNLNKYYAVPRVNRAIKSSHFFFLFLRNKKFLLLDERENNWCVVQLGPIEFEGESREIQKSNKTTTKERKEERNDCDVLCLFVCFVKEFLLLLLQSFVTWEGRNMPEKLSSPASNNNNAHVPTYYVVKSTDFDDDNELENGKNNQNDSFSPLSVCVLCVWCIPVAYI